MSTQDEYVPTEQDKVRLDYAQTAMRRADPWEEFEYQMYNAISPAMWAPMPNRGTSMLELDYLIFRRKARTITVTVPVPKSVRLYSFDNSIVVDYRSTADRDQAQAAFLEAMQEPAP